MKNIAWWNRPWHKIRTKGVSTLDDAELLSVIFVRGNKQKNALELANMLLKDHNLEYPASLSQLKEILGDDIKAYQVAALGELMKRYRKLKRKGFCNRIRRPEDIFNAFFDDMREKKKEHLYAVLLDSQNKIIQTRLISVGTLNSSLIHPREVFKPAIAESANSVILVHNHPSGDPTPSQEDIDVTEVLQKSAEILNIKLLDHIVIGRDGWKSVI